MRGYKIFGPDYTCKEYKYSITEPNVYNGEIKPCHSGFHFCEHALDCLNYYDYTSENTYALVESGDNYIVEDDKVVCDQITIIQTLTYEEFGRLLNDVKRSWHDNGQIKEETSYVNGKRNGSHKEWHDNGQLIEECTYKNGERHGIYKSWYDNGQLREEANYVDGKLHGNYKLWDQDGELYLETTYCNHESKSCVIQ